MMNKIQNTTPGSPENNIPKRKRRNFFVGLFTNPKQFIVFSLSLLIFPVLLMVYSGILPVTSYKPAPEISGNKSSVAVSIDQAQEGDILNIISLEKERNFENSRLDLASQDSIYLVVNVPARSIAIEIKGVQVRTATILRVELDQKLSLISHENLAPWLSDPFKLKKYIGTIPKIPIVVKEAPKDTIEAQKLSSKPLAPDSTVVYTSLYFDRNLVLEINQDRKPLDIELSVVKEYETERNAYLPKSSALVALLNPGSTDQPVSVKLFVSPEDARAIYRAFPFRTKMVLKL